MYYCSTNPFDHIVDYQTTMHVQGQHMKSFVVPLLQFLMKDTCFAITPFLRSRSSDSISYDRDLPSSFWQARTPLHLFSISRKTMMSLSESSLCDSKKLDSRQNRSMTLCQLLLTLVISIHFTFLLSIGKCKPISLNELLKCIEKYIVEEKFDMIFKDNDSQGQRNHLIDKGRDENKDGAKEALGWQLLER